MKSASKPEARTDENSSSNGAITPLLVGLIMVCIYLASAVLQVYERSALNSFYPGSSQFAFLRSLFPSPAASVLIDWQNIFLFEGVPFLLFFYLAVRMRIDPLGRLLPTMIIAAVVGIALSALNSILVFYQPNITHLLLAGSFSVPNSTQGGSSLIVSLSSAPWILLGNGALFAAMALTGISFGSFWGETPYWIARRQLDPEGESDEEGSLDQASTTNVHHTSGEEVDPSY